MEEMKGEEIICYFFLLISYLVRVVKHISKDYCLLIGFDTPNMRKTVHIIRDKRALLFLTVSSFSSPLAPSASTSPSTLPPFSLLSFFLSFFPQCVPFSPDHVLL